MGKKLDAILGRNNFKTYKFQAVSNLAVSRLAIYKKQRQAKLNHARSDVIELLRLGHRQRALLRVEHVIKEQNMLDVYVMMEDYCNLVVERVHLIEQERVCPDELKEAISSLLFASSRCGDFPELQEMRLVFTSRYGKDFAAAAIELRNNCGVSRRMIQKMSTRQPDLETRSKLLREIASENGITFEIDEPSPSPSPLRENKGEASSAEVVSPAEEIGRDDEATDSVRLRRRKYKDVADAAQAAFQSAAYAAEAARAAVELSRSDPPHPDHNNHKSPEDDDDDDSDNDERQQQLDTDSEPEEEAEEVAVVETKAAVSEGNLSSSSLDPETLARKLDKEIEFDDSSDEETEGHDINVIKSEAAASSTADSTEHIPSIIQTGLKVDSVEDGYPNPPQAATRESRTTRTLNRLKAPFSVRTTRHVRGY